MCFLFVSIPKKPFLRSYRNASYIMACAYLSFAAINVVEYFGHSSGENICLLQMITLVVGCSQAFLFTYVFIILIDPYFFTGQRIGKELAIVLLFMTSLFLFYVIYPEAMFKALFRFFILLYIMLLVRFTHLFLTNYRRYCIQMDNYYSDWEFQRLRWILVSFFVALAIGVIALVNALFMSMTGALLFSVVLIGFYTFFAIRFINYGLSFQHIEAVVTAKAENQEKETAEDDKITLHAFSDIEEKLEEWIAGKKFVERGITVERLAAQIYTNRAYVSTYINTCKKQTFRDWMNDLRIKESKELLLQYPDMAVHEVALRTGFANQSNFGRQFLKQTGVSPQVWRRQNDGKKRRHIPEPD
jgi:AraC-like DNA-binding protein